MMLVMVTVMGTVMLLLLMMMMMVVVVMMMMMLVEAMMTMTAFMMRMTLTQGSCGHLRQGDCPAGRSQCGTANGIRIGARPIRVRGHVGTLRINCIWLL